MATEPLCKNCMRTYCTYCAPAVQRQRDKLLVEEPLQAVKMLLRHVRHCTCGAPATYARFLCDLCDICAADPELEWDGYGTKESNKEKCLLLQAHAVRIAMKLLEKYEEKNNG